MKFTLSWLKEHLDTNASLQEINETLTSIGLEVEEIIARAAELADFTVAEITAAEKHPNADKLQVCKVNSGKEELQIVCGAPNARAGLKVVLAPVGTWIPAGEFNIKKAKIRDVESCGMLCSASELGLGEDSDGIIELSGDAKVGEKAATWLGADDAVIDIAITPNRGDCLGVHGIARDLAAAGVGKLKPLKIKPVKGCGDSPISVAIENPVYAPMFIGRHIKGVKNAQSPAWLKARLESIGLKPISALVDITNFLTYDLGRPAHVYDAGTLSGNLTVREAKDGEKLTALDEKEYVLEDGMEVIADENGPVALGGVIGGLETGCTEETTDVFLEIALFQPVMVAMTGRKLQIDTDARYRFERGVDAALMMEAAEYATQLIIEACGGKASDLVMAGTIPHWENWIEFDPKSVEQHIGITPSDAEMESVLAALGFGVEKEGKSWKITTPSWRHDISGQHDIVEEIARIYGYDKIPSVPMPRQANIASALTPMQQRLGQIRRDLASRSLREVVSFSFVSSKEARAFAANDNLAVLENPISAELDAMRPSILPSLLAALGRNEARGNGDVGLFEIGPVFSAPTPEGQRASVAGIRSGEAERRNAHSQTREVDAFDAKADLFAALNYFLPAEKAQVEQGAPSYYHPGRSGTLKLGKQVLGYFGEVHPSVLQELDVKGPVVAFELFPEAAPAPKNKKSSARAKLELSNFQAVERDFAFIVDEAVSVAAIEKAVRQAEKNLLEEVQVFDIYQGKGVDEGKKSIALSIRLQPKDKTLTDQEIEKVSSAVVANVEKAVGGVLRG